MPDFAVTLKRTYHFKDAYNAHSAQERAIDHANHASIAGYGGSWREEHVESVVNVNALPKTTTFTLTQDEIDVVARALACSYREHRGSSSIDTLLSKVDVNKIAREERDLIVRVAAKLKLTKKFFNPSAID